ncbi:MAG: enoyl-CoA hydratase/carnithine racemase [Planctomycetota bacterium]|jgi:enoyl-CoA hydratase/carnithine racemase
MTNTVITTVNNGVAEIVLSRPQRLNAINDELLVDFTAALRDTNANDEVGVIILSGAGKAFCAGDDLKESHTQSMSEDEIRQYLEDIQEITRLIMGSDKVVIGAVHGWAAGGGFEWLLNCDFAILAENTRCFFPELSLGIFVTGGISSILPHLVGLPKARELILLGEKIDAQTAYELGIAWKVVAEAALLDEARVLAARLMAVPHKARGRAKQALNQSPFMSMEQAMALETTLTTEGFMDPDTAQRAAAAINKS